MTVLRKLIVDTVNADPHLPWGHLDDETAERVAEAVLAQLPDVAEVTTEWAVRWTDAPEAEQIDHLHPTEDGGQSYARRVHAQYPHRTEVVSREVRRGPWNPVTTGGAS
ncbi:MAG: hypothetical protein L0I24_01110 [Pseudonocardia sp.]|nr:hypothetical protein [Pseudonocardia sp.]